MFEVEYMCVDCRRINPVQVASGEEASMPEQKTVALFACLYLKT